MHTDASFDLLRGTAVDQMSYSGDGDGCHMCFTVCSCIGILLSFRLADLFYQHDLWSSYSYVYLFLSEIVLVSLL